MSAYDDESPPEKRIPIRCDCGKACFPSHAAAKRSIRQMQHNNRERRCDGRLHPYFCRPGRTWHVGHTETL